MPRTLQVALVQLAMAPDKATNVARACAEIRAAGARGARLVCLPELFAGPYFCQTEDVAHFDLAEPIPGPTSAAVAAAAKDAGVTVVASLFERRAAGVYHNTSATIGPDGALLGKYRKMHVPDDPLFLEKFYFTPGDLGFVAQPTPAAVVGSLVCWDQWYPEAARLTALRGAEVLCYPTAIGWQPYEKAEWGAAQLDAWRTVQRGHAIANGVFVVAVNRVGHEGDAGGGIQFWGHSFVADPFGVVLAEAGEGEETLVVELELDRIEQVRRWWPFLRDRRVDAYGDLTRRLIDP